jgi:hypothetical protein
MTTCFHVIGRDYVRLLGGISCIAPKHRRPPSLNASRVSARALSPGRCRLGTSPVIRQLGEKPPCHPHVFPGAGSARGEVVAPKGVDIARPQIVE